MGGVIECCCTFIVGGHVVRVRCTIYTRVEN